MCTHCYFDQKTKLLPWLVIYVGMHSNFGPASKFFVQQFVSFIGISLMVIGFIGKMI